ncbi:MAG: biotin/lipoyl-containing protein [Fimbriimonadales bacterium]
MQATVSRPPQEEQRGIILLVSLPINLVEQCLKVMERHHLQELQLEVDDVRIALERAVPTTETPTMAVIVPTKPEPESVRTEFTPIEAPMTGMFYRGPSPQEPPYVEEGDTVYEGQTIGLIEAMKVFNEVPCPITGVVRKILAQNATLVQQGDILMLVEQPE